jgi:hypothetical protein
MKAKTQTVMSLVAVLGTTLSGALTAPIGADQAPHDPAASFVLSEQQDEAESASSGGVMFIENVGQLGDGARFQVRGGNGTIWLAEDAVWVTVVEKPPSTGPLSPAFGEEDVSLPFHAGREDGDEGTPRKGVNLKLSFVGANPHPILEPFDRLDTHVSYFVGDDPEGWHADVPVWGGARYKGLYPGIDLEITGNNGQVVQRLVAGEGAALDAVRLRVEGADEMALDGDLLRLRTATGEHTLSLPQVNTAVSEHLPPPTVDGNQVTSPFGHPQREAATPDPPSGASDLLFASFLGGSSDDLGYDIATDVNGAAYVTGYTLSPDFPTTAGAFDTSFNGGNLDAFVVKLNGDGSALDYATFLAGSSNDRGEGIAVDAGGAAYVTGRTFSADFPTTAEAFDASSNGLDAFVVKLNAAGSALTYATFLGGSSNDEGRGIAIDTSGAAYVTGLTNSSDFPTTAGAFDTSFSGGNSAFVVKLNAGGSALVYATFLGGSDSSEGYGIASDESGAAYITGWTLSSDFPTTAGAFDTSFNGGYRDAFVVKLNAGGSMLAYATFLGGSDEEDGESIAIEPSGAAYVTGTTLSSDFPTTVGAFDTSFNGYYYNAYAARLNAAGSALSYATFLGGSGGDWGHDIAVDETGAACVTGETGSSDFPTTAGAFDTSHNGGYDAFLLKLNTAGSALSYATFLGGSNFEESLGIAVDPAGAVFVAGETLSSDFPTTAGAFDPSFNGGNDAVVLKIAGQVVPEPWTVMVYLDGDNNLGSAYSLPVFNNLERAADNPNAQIVAALDLSGTDDSGYYAVQHDTDLSRLADYTSGVNYWPKGELNMGAPGTLADFVDWARANYPAQHYALILSNHGSGLGGGMWDNTSNGDHLTVIEIGTALASATLEGASKIDVLYMDACLMAMIEDAYQVRDYVDWYVASENIKFGFDTPYYQAISSITSTTTPAHLAALFTTTYADACGAASSPCTMSTADISRLSDAVAETNSLAQLLDSQMATSATTLTSIRSTVQRFEMNGDNVIDLSDDYIDLYDFARLVKASFSDSDVQEAAQGLMDDIVAYITAEHHGSGTTGGQVWNLDNSHGVSVLFPSTASSFYAASNYDFATGAIWPSASGISAGIEEGANEWGPMLVNYFQTTQPGGPDNPAPPEPLPLRLEFELYLPVIASQ